MNQLALRVFLSFVISLFCSQGQGQGIGINAKKRCATQAERSLVKLDGVSGDFDDLKFLKEELANKRIVYIGESNHHSETYNKIKFKLIRFLHEEMGFNVVAFEGNVSSCFHANLVKDRLSPLALLTHSILGCWRTDSNFGLMEYIKKNEINLTGFDPNLNSLILERPHYEFIFAGNPSLGSIYFQLDSTMQEYQFQRGSYLASDVMDAGQEEMLNGIRDSLLISYSGLSSGLDTNELEDEVLRYFETATRNKIELLKSSNSYKDAVEVKYVTNAEREELMHRNMEFILDTVYADQKVIVWAHNAHISKGGPLTELGRDSAIANNSLGYRLNEKYGFQSYTIGLYGYPGIIGTGFSTKTAALKKPRRNSLEAIMYKTNVELFFLKTNMGCLERPLYNFTEGGLTVRSIISDCYDAIIYSQDLEPAILIRFDQKDSYE